MEFDGFRLWCEQVERDLDPGTQMLHFLRQEVPTATEAEWYQVEALTSSASTLALNICRQAGKSSTLAAMGVRELQAGGTTIALCPAERHLSHLLRTRSGHPEKSVHRRSGGSGGGPVHR